MMCVLQVVNAEVFSLACVVVETILPCLGNEGSFGDPTLWLSPISLLAS